jgi:hypothetical protein
VTILAVGYLFYSDKAFYYFLGPYHLQIPFADMHGRLSAMEAYAKGYDVIKTLKPNPLDPYHRANIKPSYYLPLGNLGIDREWLMPSGILLVIVFISICILLLKPKNISGVLISISFVLSPPVILGLERGNDDLIYFCILALVPWLLNAHGNRINIVLSAMIIILVTPAKYYPIVTSYLLVHKIKFTKFCVYTFIVTLAAITVILIPYIDEIIFLKQHAPSPKGLYSFGAGQVFEYLGMNVPNYIVISVYSALVLVVTAARWSTDIKDCTSSSLEEKYFLLGSFVLIFCFLTRFNFDYRLVYFIFCLPYITRRISLNSDRILPSIFLITAVAGFWVEAIVISLNFNTDSISWNGDVLNSILPTVWKVKQFLLWIMFVLAGYYTLRLIIQNAYRLYNMMGTRGVKYEDG